MEQRLKVLMVAFNNLGRGGIQNQFMGIIRSLNTKVEFDVVIWDNVRNSYRSELDEYHVNVIECFRSIGSNRLRQKADAFIRYREIKRIIKNVLEKYGPYDAIHCNNAYDAAPCMEAAYEMGIPVRISHAHNMENPELKKKITYPAYKLLYAYQRKRIRKYATHMIACSRQVADYFFGKNLGQVVHIGVELSEFYNKSHSKNRNDCFELLHVGSMSQQKNQLFLVDVMKELLKIRQDVRLTMFGSNSVYYKKVIGKILEYDLESFVKIKPAEASVSEAMAQADIFVFPSTFEGFGIVLIEAQASGLKCIASDVVTREADCGGIQYLPLKSGAGEWALQISRSLDMTPANRESYDVSEFSVAAMSGTMYQIYSSAQGQGDAENDFERD